MSSRPSPAATPASKEPPAPVRGGSPGRSQGKDPQRPHHALGDAGPTPRDPAAALVFDDPLSQPSRDDTDSGWGERPVAGGAGDLARFLDEKPPHHL
jgi:hypothetical protein